MSEDLVLALSKRIHDLERTVYPGPRPGDPLNQYPAWWEPQPTGTKRSWRDVETTIHRQLLCERRLSALDGKNMGDFEFTDGSFQPRKSDMGASGPMPSTVGIVTGQAGPMPDAPQVVDSKDPLAGRSFGSDEEYFRHVETLARRNLGRAVDRYIDCPTEEHADRLKDLFEPYQKAWMSGRKR